MLTDWGLRYVFTGAIKLTSGWTWNRNTSNPLVTKFWADGEPESGESCQSSGPNGWSGVVCGTETELPYVCESKGLCSSEYLISLADSDMDF